MVKLKCDFCGTDAEFVNMKDVLGANLTLDTDYYVICTKCAEKINNLVNGSYQVIQINSGDD